MLQPELKGAAFQRMLGKYQIVSWHATDLSVEPNRQITISLRDESGDVVQARQMSTQARRIHAFVEQLIRERRDHEGSLTRVGPTDRSAFAHRPRIPAATIF
jgi:hypothetical protein